MSATNATTNYSLPLFIGTDKPTWLVDWNSAMTDIDAQMKVNATAILANETAISGLSTTVSAHTTSINTISGQITTLTTGLNTAQGNINTINSLIGNGEPTTSDKTLIGAINEIYGMITGGGGQEIQAANVSFDGTVSGLTASTVQAAIDEVYAAIPSVVTPTAANVSYSNTTSGLTATNVQAAIDEIAQSGGEASNDFGTSVTLADATYYTTTADGYVTVAGSSAQGSNCHICGASQDTSQAPVGGTTNPVISKGGAGTSACSIVRKGMKLYPNLYSGDTAVFYPLV